MEQKSPIWIALSALGTVGYSVAVPLVIFAIIGRFLDVRYSTSPLFLLLGIFLSLFATTIMLFQKIKELQILVQKGEGLPVKTEKFKK